MHRDSRILARIRPRDKQHRTYFQFHHPRNPVNQRRDDDRQFEPNITHLHPNWPCPLNLFCRWDNDAEGNQARPKGCKPSGRFARCVPCLAITRPKIVLPGNEVLGEDHSSKYECSIPPGERGSLSASRRTDEFRQETLEIY